MTHQSMGPIMSNCSASGAAENVAYGQPSNAAVVKAWFNSPGHKANMLNKGYTHMGAAVAYGSDGAPYYAQDRKSTRLNSSHVAISYAVVCLRKNSQFT